MPTRYATPLPPQLPVGRTGLRCMNWGPLVTRRHLPAYVFRLVRLKFFEKSVAIGRNYGPSRSKDIAC